MHLSTPRRDLASADGRWDTHRNSADLEDLERQGEGKLSTTVRVALLFPEEGPSLSAPGSGPLRPWAAAVARDGQGRAWRIGSGD